MTEKLPDFPKLKELSDKFCLIYTNISYIYDLPMTNLANRTGWWSWLNELVCVYSFLLSFNLKQNTNEFVDFIFYIWRMDYLQWLNTSYKVLSRYLCVNYSNILNILEILSFASYTYSFIKIYYRRIFFDLPY